MGRFWLPGAVASSSYYFNTALSQGLTSYYVRRLNTFHKVNPPQ